MPSAAAAPADLDTAVRRVRRLGEILRELIEMAMALARAVHDEALGGRVSLEAVNRFTRIARAIRRLVALEARLAKALADVETGAWAAEDAARRLNEIAAEAKKTEAVETFEAIVREGEGVERERLIEKLGDWYSERAVEKDFAQRPASEIVVRACKDLGIAPDPAILAEPAMSETLADAVRAYAAAREGYFGDTRLNSNPRRSGAPSMASRIRYCVPEIAANPLADPRPPPA